MNLKKKISDEDLQRIKGAVRQAEASISGEIVPVIVERSDPYSAATFKAAIITSTFFFLIIIVIDRYVIEPAGNTLFYDPVFIFFAVVLGGLLGALVSSVDRIRRALTSRTELDACSRQRAEAIFLEEEIFNTRHRTGIMIFISFFEHEVIVMADRGISKVVDQKEWDKIVQDLIHHIRTGKIVEGIEAGVKRCGEILLEKGFHKTDDDVNELRDDLRIS